jgi:hypothetical protein
MENVPTVANSLLSASAGEASDSAGSTGRYKNSKKRRCNDKKLGCLQKQFKEVQLNDIAMRLAAVKRNNSPIPPDYNMQSDLV